METSLSSQLLIIWYYHEWG